MKDLKSVEDFMLDETFLNYVFKKNILDIESWERYILLHPEQNTIIFRAKQEVMDIYSVVGEIHAEENYNLLLQRIQRKSESKIYKWKKLYWIASCLALFLVSVSGYIIYNKYSVNHNSLEYTTESSQKQVIMLKDGTRAVLNSNSKLLVSKDFGVEERKIEIEGEVYLDVAKNPNKPFIISTRTLDVCVLGTILNIRSYPDDEIVETSLIEGSAKVILKNKEKSTILLKPADKIVTLAHPLEKEESIDVELLKEFKSKDYVLETVRSYDSDEKVVETSWTDQKLVFSNESLFSIAKILERWYDVKIVFEDNDLVRTRKYTAAFDDNEKLQNILESLRASISFNYKQTDNNIIIIKAN